MRMRLQQFQRRRTNNMAEEKNQTTDAATDGKKKIGAFLTAKGAAIGAAIGTVLITIGAVLQEQTSWFSAVISLLKEFLF